MTTGPITPETSFHPRPTGWYAVATSAELRAGCVQSKELFSQRFAVFRSEAGVASVLGATCPHLGADLSRGRVCGEHLRCPFHGFEFDRAGRCAAIPSEGRPPPRAQTRSLPVREREGLILAWWDEHGRAPSWEPAGLETQGWSSLHTRRFELRAHPLSTSENSVDLAHFSSVHGFEALEVLEPARAEGPYLSARYRFVHRFAGLPVENLFRVHLWGLGYSLVENLTPSLGLSTRLWVLATPTRPGHMELRVGTSTRTRLAVVEGGEQSPWSPAISGRSLGRATTELIARFALRTLAADVRADFDIWSHRTHVERPALAKGDGAIALYRRWARQFDVSPEPPANPGPTLHTLRAEA